MNGIHDLGGMDGTGPIERDEDGTPFREDWEAAVFAMAYGTGDGAYNTDEGRYAIEQMPPAAYLDASYYERWLFKLERELTDSGVVDEADLGEAIDRLGATGTYHEGLPERTDPALAEKWLSLDRSDVTARRGPVEPAYEAGDTVSVKNIHPEGHTRCPRYVRRAKGEVIRIHGAHVFPDTNAMGEGEQPEPLYTVEFDGAALWGEDGDENVSIRIDLFESYLTATDE